MSRKYKFHNPSGIYFVSFATVYWVDVFTRRIYSDTIINSLNYCITKKGMELYAYCIMTNHIHLIFRDNNDNPSKLLKEFKVYTSKELRKLIENNIQESRREWMLWMMKKAGKSKSNITTYQFWQQHNKPIELWSNEVIEQKIDYIHNNPVDSGFVSKPEHWKYSSANDYCGNKGLLDICLL